MPRIIVAAVFVSTLTAGALLHAAINPPEIERQRTGMRLRLAYLEIIDGYQDPGGRSEAVRAFCQWGPAELDRLVSLLSDSDFTRTLAPARVRAALGLHTDTAQCRGSGTHPAILRAHLRLAWAVASALHDAGKGALVRDWFLATSLAFLHEFPTETAEHLLKAENLFPSDPVIAIRLGTTFEIMASRHAVPRGGAFAQRESPCAASAYRECLNAAQKRYRRIVADSKVSPESRLRLGRTEHLLGKSDAAARMLRPLRQEGVAPYDYLATVFLADLAAEQGQTAQAAELYEAAIEMSTSPYAAAIQASSFYERFGDLDTSLDLLQLAIRSGARTNDPMLLYQTGRLTLDVPTLSELRGVMQR